MTFPTPCRANFEKLANEDPDYLLQWVDSGTLEDCDLTFAAEYLGYNHNSVPTLIRLLRTGSTIVKEGAAYGLARIYHDIYDCGLQQAIHTQSPGLRSALKSAFCLRYEDSELDEMRNEVP